MSNIRAPSVGEVAFFLDPWLVSFVAQFAAVFSTAATFFVSVVKLFSMESGPCIHRNELFISS